MLPLGSLHESQFRRDHKLYFNLHRRVPMFPLIKRYVSNGELMEWNPDPLKESLSLFKPSTRILVKTIDKIIGEVVKWYFRASIQHYQWIVAHWDIWEYGALVDEIYLQIMRRINETSIQKYYGNWWFVCDRYFPTVKGMSLTFWNGSIVLI